jgi:hypothetical protein
VQPKIIHPCASGVNLEYLPRESYHSQVFPSPTSVSNKKNRRKERQNDGILRKKVGNGTDEDLSIIPVY